MSLLSTITSPHLQQYSLRRSYQLVILPGFVGNGLANGSIYFTLVCGSDIAFPVVDDNLRDRAFRMDNVSKLRHFRSNYHCFCKKGFV